MQTEQLLEQKFRVGKTQRCVLLISYVILYNSIYWKSYSTHDMWKVLLFYQGNQNFNCQSLAKPSLSERGQDPEWASFKPEKGDFLAGLSKHGENEVEEDV